MEWHNLSSYETLKELQVSEEKGLAEKDVIKRRHKYGMNVIETKKNKNIFVKFIEQFSDFMIIILICAATISFVVSLLNGEINFVDPIIILFIITLNAILGVIQETKAEHSLEALKKMSAPKALVKRDGIIKSIDATLLVPGDIIYLESGQFVPADARLITAINLKIEESSLTGESHPVEKDANTTLLSDTLLAERKNMVMSTSIIIYGRGTAVVTNTGMNTEVGNIAKLIMNDDTPLTPLQKRLDKTSKILGTTALIICIIIFIMGIIKKLPIFDMFMISVSLAVAAIPEGLPAIVTIMLSLGVLRMAKKNAVIRKLPAVETLGSATVICSDKTGTLTKNEMTVTYISSFNGKEVLNSSFAKSILSLASLCNNTIVQNVKKSTKLKGEPTEKAIIVALLNCKEDKIKLDLQNQRIYEIPFDSTRKLMTTVHKEENGKFKSITKGAPDILINRCNTIYENGKITDFTEYKKSKVSRQNTTMASNALRVIAVAYKEFNNKPNLKDEKSLENSLTFLGLLGMIDPPRDNVKESVSTCKKAGIKPVMITGDHITTACAIAKELGIMEKNDMALSGMELSNMTPEYLASNINRYSVFARVSPEHKVRIVKAFQKNGEVVAMTGDGVNDAPALKVADIGCAMGMNGTDVAKNAADMILTDDNFTTIVSAIKEGRGIYDNIKKAVHFLLSSNIGEIVTIFIAILFGLPAPLLAVQLLWVNLVTDSLPAIALGVEPPDKYIMDKKPISPSKGLFSDGLIFKIIFEGIMIGVLSLFAFIIGAKYYDTTKNPIIGRTMAFAVLSLAELFHAFNMRSEYSLFKIGLFSNMKLLIAFIICTILQIAVISIKQLSIIFKVVPLTSLQWFIVFIISFIPIIVVELQKHFNKDKN